jgi:hypothetical protein
MQKTKLMIPVLSDCSEYVVECLRETLEAMLKTRIINAHIAILESRSAGKANTLFPSRTKFPRKMPKRIKKRIGLRLSLLQT